MAKKAKFYKVLGRTAQNGEFMLIIPAYKGDDIRANYHTPEFAVLSAKYIGNYEVHTNIDQDEQQYFYILSKRNIDDRYVYYPNDFGYQYLAEAFRPQVEQLWQDFNDVMYPYDPTEEY